MTVVQRLVHVELRHRDVVLEPPRHGVPPRVQRAERRVAVPDAVHQDARADEVVDLREVVAAHDHLLVDRVVVLRPAGDGRLDLRAAQVGRDLLAHDGQVLLARRRALGDEVDDLVVHLGVQGLERQVLELPLDRVHAEAVGERRVDLEGLARLAPCRRRRHVLPGAGVVQAVGELDDEHADVARHGDDHLAHRLGLRRVAVRHLVELGHAVDEHGDLLAVLLGELRERVVGVLDRVVQQRGGERRPVEPELGEDRRDRDGVRDVRVAALAQLAAVGALGGLVGALDDAEVRAGWLVRTAWSTGSSAGLPALGRAPKRTRRSGRRARPSHRCRRSGARALRSARRPGVLAHARLLPQGGGRRHDTGDQPRRPEWQSYDSTWTSVATSRPASRSRPPRPSSSRRNARPTTTPPRARRARRPRPPCPRSRARRPPREHAHPGQCSRPELDRRGAVLSRS